MKERIEFYKLSGSGNDFIVIDNRGGLFAPEEMAPFVRRVCSRRSSVGADGLIFIENSSRADFSWRFFNCDGSEAEMCGNGGRCAARFAQLKGIAPARLVFETAVGLVDAEVKGRRVSLRLMDPEGPGRELKASVDGKDYTVYPVSVGVPHAVLLMDDISELDVEGLGRKLRFHPLFSPAGANVDFVRLLDPHSLELRTYERGVEAETLACGTGAAAAALVAAKVGGAASPVSCKTRGGETLTIYFEKKEGRFTELYLEGDTTLVYRGELTEEAWT